MKTYRADTLPDLAGPAAWNDILGPQAPPKSLTGPATCDLAIIGAGFAGLSAARRAHQLDPYARIVVLDAMRIAESSAGRNSGFMIDLPHELTSDDYAGSGDDRKTIYLNRQAIAFGREAVADYAIDPNYFDEAGKINGAASTAAEDQNRSYAKHLSTLDEGSQFLSADDMIEITGSHHYRSGLFTPGTVVLQPAGYIRGLADGLRRDGITLSERSPVTSLTRKGDTWDLTTPQGQISAGSVILTVNGHLDSFGFERGHLMQLFLFGMMTPDLDAETLKRLGGHTRWGVTPSDPMGTTMRRIDPAQGGNRIVTRTASVLRPGKRITRADLARAARKMQRKFNDRFPQLSGLTPEYTWSGHLCLSMNGVAVMRQLDDGLFAGCVQNGLGTARGTLTGIGAAELALGQTSAITRHFTAETAPKRLPPKPLQQLGANAFIRYKEWRARVE
ncbi:MAG: FAD-binding oxidoreductase [Pseudomonadota bacterium]